MVEKMKISNKEHHARKEYHGSTHLKLAYQSMFKYQTGVDSDSDEFDTKAKSFGRLYHKAVLEPKTIAEEFIVLVPELRPEPDKTMASKLNKEWAEIISNRALANGQEIVSKDDYDKAFIMKSVLERLHRNYGSESYPVISRLIQHSTPEVSFFCDNYLGIKAKCRPDILCEGMYIGDLKSVADASPDAFSKAVIKWGWDIQIALYSDLIAMYCNKTEEVPDKIMYPFYMVAQEKKEPNDFCIYDVSDFYELGKLKLLKAIDRIKSESRDGYWGLIPADKFSLKLSVPKWAFNELDATPIISEPDYDNNEDDEEF